MLKEILDKKVTKQEFIGLMGVGTLALFALPFFSKTILNLIMKKNTKDQNVRYENGKVFIGDELLMEVRDNNG